MTSHMPTALATWCCERVLEGLLAAAATIRYGGDYGRRKQTPTDTSHETDSDARDVDG